MPKGNLPAKDKSKRPFVSTCDFQKRSQGTLGPGWDLGYPWGGFGWGALRAGSHQGTLRAGWPGCPGTGLGSRVPLGRVRMGRPEGGFASGYPKGGLAKGGLAAGVPLGHLTKAP